MKKSTKLSAILLALCLSLCACQKSNNLPEPPGSVAEISSDSDKSQVASIGTDVTNPSGSSNDSDYDKEDETEKDKKKFQEAVNRIEYLGVDFFTEKAEWIDEKTLKLPVQLEGRGNRETKFCPIVLCDGMLAQTSMDGKNFGDSECRINFAEPVSDPNNITHEIYIKPVFDSSLTTHFISLGYIINPDERPEDYWMVSGMLVQSGIIGHHSYDITGHEALCVNTIKVLESEPAVALTEKQKQEYDMTNDEYPRIYLEIEDPADSQTFSQDGKHSNNIMLAKNSNKAKFSVVAATNQPQMPSYKVMFFVNHKTVKINGEYDQLSLTLENGKISTTEVEIDGLKDKDIVYAVFCPMYENDPSAPHSKEFSMTEVHLVEEQK